MLQMVLHIFLQIILEMLPISSSGNVALFFYFVTGLQAQGQQFVLDSSFDLLLHGPAVLVIAAYFFKPWLEYFIGLLRFERPSLFLFTFCVIADVVTAAFYFLFKVTGVAFFPLCLGFFVTGIGLASLSFCKKNNVNLSLFSAFILGITQGLALLPGISRFGSTFVVARWQGFSNLKAFELSFLIAWPLMVAGTLKGFWQMYCAGQLGQLLRTPVLFSSLIATVLSWFVLQWVARLVKRNQLWKFCWWVWTLALVAFLIP